MQGIFIGSLHLGKIPFFSFALFLQHPRFLNRFLAKKEAAAAFSRSKREVAR
jgi:hypothetical protein